MKVYQRLAHAFKAEGITDVFGLMGDGNMYWMHELDNIGVRGIEARHEGSALGMADGAARVTHTPAVATATCGPGVTQLATALVTAARASSPVVAFVGEHPTSDDEYNQRLDQAPFAAACESGFVRLNTPDSADDVVRKAFYRAKVEARPILLSCPMDIQQKNFDDDDPYRPSSTLFTTQAPRPDPDVVKRAADIIGASRKPVILVGRGAMWSNAREAVLELAKRIGAVTATTLMAKSYVSDDEYHVGISGTYGTKTSMELFEEADCVIAVGASMNRYTTSHGFLYPNARFVHIDTKPDLTMFGGRAAECYVQADARAGVEAIEQALADQSLKAVGFRTPDVKKRLAHSHEDRAEFPIDPGTCDPREVALALDDIVPAHIGLAMGSGASAAFSVMMMNRPRPLVLGSHFFGCIGQMLPAAMGAIVATGNKPMLLCEGDASVMMHLAEFETAVRYNMPLLTVVMNNEMLGAEYYKLEVHKMKAELATITTPDLGAVARACGGKGALARTVDEVRSAAAEWVSNPCPMIIDVRIARGVVTLPYRRIHYGRDE